MRTMIIAFVAVLSMAAAPFPSVVDLPASSNENGLAPEGIVSGDGNTFYTGSLTTGQIVVGDFQTGETEYLVTDPAFDSSVGLAYDNATKFLWAAGGQLGGAAVYDTRTGELINVYEFAPGFINDAIVAGDSVYFTNSAAPQLYRVNADGSDGVDVITLTGPAGEFVPGFNTNGIEATADGKTLIVVNSAKGELYTVDPSTGESELIDLGGDTVFTGDGILLEGRTLYVLQNGGAPGVPNQIVKIKLSGSLTSGTIVDTITDPAFATATTVAIKGSRLAVVNAVDFGSTPFDDYTVVLLDKS